MISIIIPAHNAESFIEETIKELQPIKAAQIIVVCNNCKDNTFEKVEQLKKKYSNITNLNYPFYTGKGGAILRGFPYATGDIVGFVDADNAFYLEDVKKIIALAGKYDAVIASKWKGKDFSKVKQPLKRRIYGRIWNFLIKRMFGLDFKDTQAGLKFFRKKVIDSVDRRFTCIGFEFDIELLYKIKKAGFSIKEVPVDLREAEKSTVWTISTVPMMWNLFKLRIRSL